jgi:hypothetical protein
MTRHPYLQKKKGKTSLGHRKYKRISNNKKDIKENKKGSIEGERH